ncbi:uncharacterized protein LOC144439318 [Glandiceps talaboti]
MAHNRKTGSQTLLTFKNHVIKITSTENDGIKALVADFDEHLREFKTRGHPITWSLPNVTLQVVAAKCVAETLTGLVLPCMLVEVHKRRQSSATSQKKNNVYALVLLSLERKAFVAIGKFQSQMSLQRMNLVDGPLVCWTHESDIYYTLSSRDAWMSVHKVSLPKPCTFFHSQIINRQLLAMGASETSDSVAMETDEADANSRTKVIWGYEWIVLNLDLTGHTGQGDSNPYLDGTDFVPHAYANTVRAILVQKYHKSCCQESDVEISSERKRDDNCIIQTLIATSQGQLLQFKEGKLLKYCSLPFSDSCEMCVAMVSGGSSVVLVKSSTGKCCAIWEKTFQVAQTWEDVGQLLVDDFLHCGSDQILLIPSSESESETLNRFMLTDLQLCNINNMNACEDDHDTITMETKDSTSSSNLCKVVQALESRLQANVASVRKAEMLCEEKDQMIRKTCKSLLGMATGDEDTDRCETQYSLVCLYDGKESCKEPSTSEVNWGQEHGSEVTKKGGVYVKHGWQRVIDDKWVITVKVENSSDRPVSELSLSSVCVGGPTIDHSDSVSSCRQSEDTSSSCTLHQPSSGPSIHPSYVGSAAPNDSPPSKRQKLDKQSRLVLSPGNQREVVTMTTLPQFNSDGTCTCSLVLRWLEHTEDDSTRSESCTDKGIHRIQCVGTATLTATDMVNGKFTVEYNKLPQLKDSELTKAIKTLDATQLAIEMLIHSRYTNLMCLTQVLQDVVGFQKLPQHFGYIYTHGVLNGVRVQLQEMGYNNSVVKICTRNENQLVLAIHTLYEAMPDDVCIKVHTSIAEVSQAMRNSLQNIRSEIEETIEGCSDIIQAAQHKEINPGVEIPPREGQEVENDAQDKGSELQNARQRFDEEKRTLKNLPGSLVDEKDYVVLMSKLMRLKLRTDESLQKLSLKKS